jgi:hypothetical protein
MPRTAVEVGETYLRLLVDGIDHDRVGKPDWEQAMLLEAPTGRAPRS